jgi:hypothetical protein
MAEPRKRPIQIYLREDQAETLHKIAERRGESVAALVRQGVDLLLEQLPVEEDPLFDIVGLYDSGLGDLAEKHDEYLLRLIQDEGSHDA